MIAPPSLNACALPQTGTRFISGYLLGMTPVDGLDMYEEHENNESMN